MGGSDDRTKDALQDTLRRSREEKLRRSRSEKALSAGSNCDKEQPKRATSQRVKHKERIIRDDHPWQRRADGTSVWPKENAEKKPPVQDEVFSGGVRKFDSVPMKHSTVDNAIFGYEMDVPPTLHHLDGCAGVYVWGKDADHARYNSDTFSRGKIKIKGGPMEVSTIKYEAFNDEVDPRVAGVGGAEHNAYRKQHEGAIGQFSDEMFSNETHRGKRLYPNAPQAQTSVDDLLLKKDLQKSEAHKKQLSECMDWFAGMEGAAGVPRWNWIDQRDRFTAVTNAKDKSRLGRKSCVGAANLESNVDYMLFSSEKDVLHEEEKQTWTDKHLSSCAGRLNRECYSDKFRFAPQSEHDKRVGKRMYVNAPQQETILDTIAFSRYIPEGAAGYEWEDVVDGCAGLGHNRNKDTIFGRYHIDAEHAAGHIAGRRLYGMAFTQAIVPDPDTDDARGWGDVGKFPARLESKRVDPESTTHRAMFKPPSSQNVAQASRRTERSSENRKGAPSGVSAALRNHEENRPRRAHSENERTTRSDIFVRYDPIFEGPLSPPEPGGDRIGPCGTSLYNRDFKQLPVSAYNDALGTSAPSYFTHPEREFRSGDETMKAAFKNMSMNQYRRMRNPCPSFCPSQAELDETIMPRSSSLRGTADGERGPRTPPDERGARTPPDSIRSGSVREGQRRSSRRASSSRGEGSRSSRGGRSSRRASSARGDGVSSARGNGAYSARSSGASDAMQAPFRNKRASTPPPAY